MTQGARHNYLVDTTRDPYFYVEAPDDASPEQVEAFLRNVEEIFETRGDRSFVAVVDLTRVRLSSPLQRRKFADFFIGTQRYWESNCLAYAFIVGNMLQRGILTALFWMKPLAWPTRMFEHKADADQWVYSLIDKRT